MHRRPSGNMPLLSMADHHTARFRRAFGYLGGTKLIKDEPADAIDFHPPALLAIITKVVALRPPQFRSARQLGAAPPLNG